MQLDAYGTHQAGIHEAVVRRAYGHDSDVVRHVYNTTTFDYETRRLPEESPVEYALPLRWLDRWIAEGAVVADIGVGVGHYALHLAQRACTIHLVDIAERLLQTARARLHSWDERSMHCA